MIFLYKIVPFHQSNPRASFGVNTSKVINSVCWAHLYLSVSSKSCLLWVGWRKLHFITPITPTPFLSACYKHKPWLLVLNLWVKKAEETCNHFWLPYIGSSLSHILFLWHIITHNALCFRCCIQKWCVYTCSKPWVKKCWNGNNVICVCTPKNNIFCKDTRNEGL